MSFSIKPTNIRFTMTALMLILIIGSGVGFYLFQNFLKTEYFNDTTSAQTSNVNSQMPAIDQATVNKARNLLLSVGDYQTKINNDLQSYSSDTGINISTSFSQPADISDIQGIQTSNVTISISEAVKYDNFIKFLKLIETNLPKMQPVDLKISPVSGSSDMINVESLIVEVYIR